MAEADGLVAAFSEYAAANWGATEWRKMGRGSGTADILNNHPRLYRSLDFGDDDYDQCVWDVVPDVLREGAGPSIQEKLALVADFIPDLVSWAHAQATHRTRKRFIQTLKYAEHRLPPEWQEDARLLLEHPVANSVIHKSPQIAAGPSDASAWGSLSVSATPVTGDGWPSPAGPIATDGWPGAAAAVAKQVRKVPDIDSPQNIFLVHGRDFAAVNDVKVRVHELTGVMPQILADQAGRSDTIIEKFERRANESDYAIVLLTPDDEGRLIGSDGELHPRARQNVILELGYFFGKLGRRRVVVLNKGVEQPSDVHGLNYISYGSVTWLEDLRKELKAAGFAIRS
ncbi:TIR domain-containing protein [Arthrobacter sp. NPDC093139]|uniref:TIR domain-containing protein n=1 Tax=Arthrobacter sp. NPDC093139 TaxID=3363945 RepID=UPI0038258052